MTHPSNYELEQLFSGECDLDDIARHVKSCEQCGQYISMLQQETVMLLERESPSEFMSRIKTPESKKKRSMAPGWFGLRLPAAAWAGSAALVFGIISVFLYTGYYAHHQDHHQDHPVVDADDGASLRWKGESPVVEVFVSRNSAVRLLRETTILPGDELQYRITMPKGKTGYAAVIAHENGKFEPVFPQNGNVEPLKVRGTYELPGSIGVAADTKALSLYLVLKPEAFKVDTYLTALKEKWMATGSIDDVADIVRVHQTPGGK